MLAGESERRPRAAARDLQRRGEVRLDPRHAPLVELDTMQLGARRLVDEVAQHARRAAPEVQYPPALPVEVLAGELDDLLVQEGHAAAGACGALWALARDRQAGVTRTDVRDRFDDGRSDSNQERRRWAAAVCRSESRRSADLALEQEARRAGPGEHRAVHLAGTLRRGFGTGEQRSPAHVSLREARVPVRCARVLDAR